MLILTDSLKLNFNVRKNALEMCTQAQGERKDLQSVRKRRDYELLMRIHNLWHSVSSLTTLILMKPNPMDQSLSSLMIHPHHKSLPSDRWIFRFEAQQTRWQNFRIDYPSKFRINVEAFNIVKEIRNWTSKSHSKKHQWWLVYTVQGSSTYLARTKHPRLQVAHSSISFSHTAPRILAQKVPKRQVINEETDEQRIYF